MTNKEVIEQLEWVRNRISKTTYSPESFEAINIAIEVLEDRAKGKIEEPFITECRELAINKDLPLYFVYYEKIGILEVYVTKTKELFEKRHCSKHLLKSEFEDTVNAYLDWYLNKYEEADMRGEK